MNYLTTHITANPKLIHAGQRREGAFRPHAATIQHADINANSAAKNSMGAILHRVLEIHLASF